MYGLLHAISSSATALGALMTCASSSAHLTQECPDQIQNGRNQNGASMDAFHRDEILQHMHCIYIE